MNEWLSEKSLDGVPPPPPPPPVQLSKIEPLEVQVEEDTMYVACRPSPRNALDHMRRNSYSSVFNPYSTVATSKQSTENSIGSAKKVNCRVKLKQSNISLFKFCNFYPLYTPNHFTLIVKTIVYHQLKQMTVAFFKLPIN